MSKARVVIFVAATLVLSLAGWRMSRYTNSTPSQDPRGQASMTVTGVEAPAVESGSPNSAEPTSSILPEAGTVDSKRPINLGIPQGPFDPVLTQLPPPGRALPPTNHRVNNPAGENVSIVQSECTIATRGDTIVVGWNDGIAFVNPAETVSGYGYSVDRGETWVDGGAVPSGASAAVFGDPTVAVTNSGLWVFVSLDLGNPAGLAINRARFQNGTLTWAPSVKYVDGGGLDKEFIEYDSATNRLYMSYVGSAGRLTYSTDEGASWAAPITVASGGSINGFYPAYGVDGEVYVSWLNGLASPSARLMCRYSSDGGVSWAGSAVQVAQLGSNSHRPPQCFNRDFNVTFPSMSVDRSNGPHRGRAYFCYTDGAQGNFDAFVTHSDDKGLTWSSPIRLDDEGNTSEQFWPQVDASPIDGRVTVGWYDRRNATNNNSLCDYYITQSVDGGTTWGPNRRLSDTSVAWCGVPANIAPNFGDYTELTSDAMSIFGIWSDARGGGPDVYVGRFDDRFQLAVSGTTGQQRSVFDGGGTVWYIPNETDFTIDPVPTLDSPAELMVAALGLGTIASPPETRGVFDIAGESLHGEVSLGSSLGAVNGTFSVSRNGLNGIDLTFTSVSSPGLDQIQFLPTSQIHATLVPSGPGVVSIYGTVSMSRPIGPLAFSMGGTLHFDGSQATLDANQSIEETVTTNLTSTLHMHTRTAVADGVTADVPFISAGTNPPPLATVRATPNPLSPSTRIVYTLTHPSDGSIRIYSVTGRSLRTIAEGHFEMGTHSYPFDGRDDNGRQLPLGGYFIRFETDKVSVAGKLFVVNRD
jgi:hypothetical protein